MFSPWSRVLSLVASVTTTLVAIGDLDAAESDAVVVRSAAFEYAIAADGRNLRFIDRRTGVDHCAGKSHCAEITVGGKSHRPSKVSRDGLRVRLSFETAQVEVSLAITEKQRWIEIEVASIDGDVEVEKLVFLDVPLKVRGRPDEPFGACALALDLATRVPQLPALQTRLRAECYRRFGLVGRRVAVVAAPPGEILGVLREVIRATPKLPQTTVSGPWAHDVPFNHGSYLFNFGDLTTANVDEWIAMAKSLGFDQIDSHGGGAHFFRFGDFHLNETKWPRGWDDYREIVGKLHRNDIGAIFHTYAFFIDKRSKYATPVPHRQLDAFRSFTLAAPIDAKTTSTSTRSTAATFCAGGRTAGTGPAGSSGPSGSASTSRSAWR